MNKTEFLGIMKELNIAYGEKKFPLSKEVMDVWYKYLRGFDCRDIAVVVENHIKASAFPPAIAEVLSRERELRKKVIRENAESDRVYMAVIAAYPSGRDGKHIREIFKKLTGGEHQKALTLLNLTQNTVRSWEEGGKEKIPSLDEFLEGLIL